MRKSWLLLLLAPAALVYACGGDSTTTDGGTDATSNDVANDTSKPDTGTDTGTGNETGANDAGPDVKFTLDCFEPANCVDGGALDASYPPGDSGVVCCGTISGNGNIQNCGISGASTKCSAPNACATSFAGLATCSTATVRLCATSAECTEQGYNTCCVANTGDAGAVHVCASQQIAAISGGKIVCP